MDESREWADLALFIAERLPGEESWRSRVQGHCWFHLANVRRVANDFDGSDEAFARARELWKAGSDSDPDLLPEWLPLALEASLRREQHRFSETLKLLEQAMAASKGKTDTEQVRSFFTACELPYDAARASLDLAVLWLKEGRRAEVQELAEAMAWIFVSQKIDRKPSLRSPSSARPPSGKRQRQN